MIISNGTFIDINGRFSGDIRIIDGVITEIGHNLLAHEGENTFDAQGKIVLPGLVDVSIVSKSWDTTSLKNLRQRLLRGGVTSAYIRPYDLGSVPTDVQRRNLESSHCEDGCDCDIFVQGCDTSGKMGNIASAFAKGVRALIGITAYDSQTIFRLAQYCARDNKTFFLSCRNHSLESAGVMHEGQMSTRLGLVGLPDVVEMSEAGKVYPLINHACAKSVLMDISSEKLITWFKALQPRNLSLQVSLPHLLLTDESCEQFNSYGKTFPPLRSEKDRRALRQALCDGVITMVGSGDCLTTSIEKEGPFDQSHHGIALGEDYLAWLFTTFIITGSMQWEELVKITSYNPAMAMNDSMIGRIDKGYQAKLVIFDPNHENCFENSAFSQLNGCILYGRVESVLQGDTFINFSEG